MKALSVRSVVAAGLEDIAFISAGWWPHNPGSARITPTQLFENIFDVSPVAYVAVNELARRIAPVMKREQKCDGVYLRQHNEAADGQSVDYYYLWVFPRIKTTARTNSTPSVQLLRSTYAAGTLAV